MRSVAACGRVVVRSKRHVQGHTEKIVDVLPNSPVGVAFTDADVECCGGRAFDE